MKKWTKMLTTIACAALLIMVVSCDSQKENASGANPANNTTEPTQTTTAPTPASPLSASPDAINLASAQSVVQQVTLKKGANLVKLTSEGGAKFVVTLSDKSGNKIASLADTAEKLSDSKTVQIAEAGDYFLNIEATKPWTIVIEPTNEPPK